jgi:hypothetical protein
MPPSASVAFGQPAAAPSPVPFNAVSFNNSECTKRTINEDRCKMVDDMCEETNLYKILAVERTCTPEELRKAYISVGVLAIEKEVSM